MKKKLILILAISSISLLFACGKKYYNEWITKDGKQFYYDEKGIMLKNCYIKIGSDTYVFDEEGALVKNSIVKLDGKPSFVDDSGKLKYYGWCSSNGNWYFVNQSILQTGWIKDQGNWYYLDPNNYYMLTNQWVDGNYFVGNNGEMLANRTATIYGKTYIFDSNGIGKEQPPLTLPAVPYTIAKKTYYDLNELAITFTELNYNEGYLYYAGTYSSYITGIRITQIEPKIYYKIYDSDGYIVEDSYFYCPSGSTGEKIRGKKYIGEVKNGSVLKFYKSSW